MKKTKEVIRVKLKTGYLIFSTSFKPIKLSLTEDTGEYLAIGGWKNINTALQYAVLPPEHAHEHPYYNKVKRMYDIPKNTDITVRVKGLNSDYLLKKQEIAAFIQQIQLLQGEKSSENPNPPS